ncbi:hypothetical protein G5B37_14210 [Rasiella rasia]|uniref:Peptidase C14 caspase domain-containing protein n=1 Tax=Rasiella rasia TaxID=2744027 RepID=A0A6G6GQ43_9FLAO|nr:caspase family protein [Rasiella rasia]QIE60672.1 hypothetical protein G5B37_14210 [Rasiella rasia]
MFALTNHIYKIFILLLLPSLVFAQSKAVVVGDETKVDYHENRYAFIVGNDHYTDKKVSTLTSCRLDAQRVAAFLASDSGFSLSEEKTTVLLDATKTQFISLFNHFLSSITLPEKSTLYFYYSGHGLPGSIVPTDFNTEDPTSLISYDWVISEIEKRGIEAKVYIIDACYAGSILDTKTFDGYNEAFKNAFSAKNTSKTIAFTATTAFRVTPAGKHESLFTKYLLNALTQEATDTNVDAIISAGELFKAIEKELGVSNAPQFTGAVDFPMGSSGRDISAEKNTYQKRESENNEIGLQSILDWRKFVEDNQHNQKLLLTIIDALEAKDNTIAKAKLGFMYRKGLGVKKDEQKALTYLIPAAYENNSFAQYNLGYMYSKGIEFDMSKSKAFSYYKMAAANGDPFAQHNLGSYFYQRYRIDKGENLEKALYWYLKSAKQQLPESQTALGILYTKLSKTARNKNEQQQFEKLALSYYKKAAQQDFGYGQYQLARHYSTMENSSEAVSQATFWFKESCSNKYLRACTALLQSID